MARYGSDYGRWGGGGYGGMRSDGGPRNDWRDFPGESGWFGEASPGYPAGAYDDLYGGRGLDRPRRGRGEMRAAELMTENPACVTPDTPIAEAARAMRDLDVGIIPVVDSMDNRRLQGVITDRDIAVRAVAEGKDGSARVGEYMTKGVDRVNKNDPVTNVLGVMERGQIRRVPVTDREGRLVGIIAQADLLVEYARGDQRREAMVEETIERISEPR